VLGRRLCAISVVVLLASCSNAAPRRLESTTPRTVSPPTAPSSAPTPTSNAASSSAPTSPPDRARIGGHLGRYVGPVSRTYHYRDPKITVAPPPAGVAPGRNWLSGFVACDRGCVKTGSAVVALAMVTGPPGYPSRTGNLFDRKLAYIVTWETTGCFGAAGKCRDAYVVPDDTGDDTFAFEIPAGTPIPS
jgi:hypothetical protein